MISELARVTVGVPVAALAVVSVPWLVRRSWVAVIVGAFVIAGFAWPLLPTARGWVVMAGGIVTCAWMAGAEPISPVVKRVTPSGAIGIVGLAVVVALVVSAGDVRQAAGRVLDDDDVWFVVSLGLLAVPVGGRLVAWLLQPYADQVAPGRPSLVAAGRLIGWLERSVLFALLVAGQPEAAGLALAAKTVARFPQLQSGDEAVAEYILVGTLASIGVAGGCAIVVRSALGLSVL